MGRDVQYVGYKAEDIVDHGLFCHVSKTGRTTQEIISDIRNK